MLKFTPHHPDDIIETGDKVTHVELHLNPLALTHPGDETCVHVDADALHRMSGISTDMLNATGIRVKPDASNTTHCAYTFYNGRVNPETGKFDEKDKLPLVANVGAATCLENGSLMFSAAHTTSLKAQEGIDLPFNKQDVKILDPKIVTKQQGAQWAKHIVGNEKAFDDANRTPLDTKYTDGKTNHDVAIHPGSAIEQVLIINKDNPKLHDNKYGGDDFPTIQKPESSIDGHRFMFGPDYAHTADKMKDILIPKGQLKDGLGVHVKYIGGEPTTKGHVLTVGILRNPVGLTKADSKEAILTFTGNHSSIIKRHELSSNDKVSATSSAPKPVVEDQSKAVVKNLKNSTGAPIEINTRQE